MMIGVKGKQLCAGNPNAAGQTDGRTDGHVDSSIPPNFVAGGVIKRSIVHKSMNGPFVVILYNVTVKCLNQRSGRNLCCWIARKTQTW